MNFEPKQPQVQPDGSCLTDRVIRKGMHVSIITAMLGTAWMAVILNMPLQMYLEALGASGLVIGLTGTIVQLSMLAQIPGALVTEHLNARKPFVFWVILFQRLLWFIPAFLPWLLCASSPALQWWVLGVVTVSAFLGQFVSGSWLSWMADLIPESISGQYWGRRQQYTMVMFLVTLWGAGYILDLFPSPATGGTFIGFTIVFCYATIMGCSDTLVHLKVPEPIPEHADRQLNVLKRIIDPLLNRNFRFITLAYGCWAFALGITGALANVYLKRQFGVDYSNIAAITISASLGTIIVGPVWGYIIDRIGARSFAVMVMILTPCMSFAWLFVTGNSYTFSLPFIHKTITLAQPILLLLVVNLFAGAVASGAWLSQMSLLSVYAPRKGRTMAMAIHSSCIGLIGAVGPVLGGYIMDALVSRSFSVALPWGTAFTYMQVLVLLHIGAIWFIAIPLLLRVQPRSGELPVHVAASRLLVANPLRAVRSMYNIMVMQSAVPREKRAEAAANLGTEKTAIAVRDLIEKLTDASHDVREAAVFALGAIGSQDAVEALLEKLDDPDSDLAPQLARALRQTGSPKGVEPLMKKLDDLDRETLRESARALGVLGDRRASGSLLSLLKTTDDAAVFTASSEALAQLGEIAAIYDILPRMHSTANPVLHRTLAVAVGDLLVPGGAFYEALISEQKARCSQTDKLVKQLKKAIRSIAFGTMIQEGGVLLQKCDEVGLKYEAELYTNCADLIFDLAIGIAALTHGAEFGGDSKPFIDDLVWRDQHFGIGVWYLDLMRRHIADAKPTPAHSVDLLIGLFFLANYTSKTATECN
jgi:MFS family permease